MEYYIEEGIAVITGLEKPIGNVQSAIDLIASVVFELRCNRMVVPISSFAEDFYNLSSGLAGDILQKFENYQVCLAIYGDFSIYKSKALQDFIRESNRGKRIRFVESEAFAIRELKSV